MFKIVNLTTKQNYMENDEILLFENGADAGAKAAWLTRYDYNRGKFAPKPYTPPSNEWKKREQARFDSGEYVRVPPEFEKHCLPDHFVHVAIKNPEKISYTATPEKGIKDRQTLASVVGYLERYAPTLTQNEREELDDLYSDRFSTYELKFAITADEIEKVYTHYDSGEYGVAQSCMRYEMDEDSEFISEIHPVRVYGDSDLQVAFITNSVGETAARALIWPEKKIYSRVYGGDTSGNKLHRLLKKSGYKKSCGYFEDEDVSEHSLMGALIQAIPYRRKNMVNAHVMPYIDEYCDVGLVTVNGKEWMRIGNTQFNCQGIYGLTHEEEELEGVRCEYCDNHLREEEPIRVRCDRWNTQNWCPSCVENDAFFCTGSNEYRASDVYEEIIVNGKVYSDYYCRENFIECPECSTYHTEPLLKVMEEDGDIIEMCQNCFDENYGDKWEIDETTGNYTKKVEAQVEIVVKPIETKTKKVAVKKKKKKSLADFGLNYHTTETEELWARAAAEELQNIIDNQITDRIMNTDFMR